MAEINKIQLSDGTQYDIEDTVARNNFAENFSSTSTYEVGDVVLYQGELYQCTTAIVTVGEWDVNDWTLVKMTDVAGNNTSLIDAINNPTYTTTEGTYLSIANTRVGKMKFEYYGDTEQETYTGKNLFDKNNANILSDAYIGANGITSASGGKTLYISCDANTTYTVSKVSSQRFAVCTTNVTPALNVAIEGRIVDLSATSITITTNASANYLCVFYYLSTADTKTEQEILDTIQIEKRCISNFI